MQPAIFLDRDGVIIENRADYVLSWNDVCLYPQALTALARIKGLPYRIVIVTNQSAVGRGLISLDEAQAINQRIVREIKKAGGRIDRVYMCPHAPWDNCECRKPKPGLLTQAAEELSLDLAWSTMIGDALTWLGQPYRVTAVELVQSSLIILSVWFLVDRFGVLGAAASWLPAAFAAMIVSIIFMNNMFRYPFSGLLSPMLAVIAASSSGAIIGFGIDEKVGGLSGFILGSVSGIAIAYLLLWLADRRFHLGFVRNLILFFPWMARFLGLVSVDTEPSSV